MENKTLLFVWFKNEKRFKDIIGRFTLIGWYFSICLNIWSSFISEEHLVLKSTIRNNRSCGRFVDFPPISKSIACCVWSQLACADLMCSTLKRDQIFQAPRLLKNDHCCRSLESFERDFCQRFLSVLRPIRPQQNSSLMRHYLNMQALILLMLWPIFCLLSPPASSFSSRQTM